MNKSLYGASVQGIQEFIFKTNKLQEIVGASEIVKNISKLFEDSFNADEILLNAAGNIKAIFYSKDECKKAVLEFSKMVMQQAYGITISQAVVKIDSNKATQNEIDELERKLKIQRNKPSIPLDLSINLMKLNPSTAKPMVNKDEDRAISQKRQAYVNWFKEQRINNDDFEKSKELSFISNGKNKIAVIHIDGNGLGEIVKKLGKKLSTFSIALNNATIKAVDDAKGELKDFRKVIIGGDDVTVICNANDALDFTKNFLQNFEDNTEKIKELDGIKDKLTACAGIAYCNEKYPFHYAVDLAEALCGVAKKHSKRKSSCLMFHNIQSSNYQSWDKFVKDELTINNNIKCDFGPYYLNKDGQATIDNLYIVTESLRLKDSPSSKLRNWLSELYKSEANANNLLTRIDKVANENKTYNKEILNQNLERLHPKLKLNNLIIDGKTPIYDILQILSITEAKK